MSLNYCKQMTITDFLRQIKTCNKHNHKHTASNVILFKLNCYHPMQSDPIRRAHCGHMIDRQISSFNVS